MDKLQWFKFVPTDWIMGKIQRCPEITQARYIRLLCLYWNKECVVTIEDAEIEVDKEHLDILIDKKIIKLDNQHIKIEFLDEQMIDITAISEKRRESVVKRWEKVKQLNKEVLQTDTNVLQTDTEESIVEDRKSNSKGNTLFRNSIYFDKDKFKQALPEWSKTKLSHYYESALNWSDSNGEMKKDWIATVKTWARKDELDGKKFETKPNPITGMGLLH